MPKRHRLSPETRKVFLDADLETIPLSKLLELFEEFTITFAKNPRGRGIGIYQRHLKQKLLARMPGGTDVSPKK